jgi:hypothetical protein
MVEAIYFLKPAWCGNHRAGLWPEIGLTARYCSHRLQAVVFTFRFNRRTSKSRGKLFFRLVQQALVQQAVATDPATYKSMVHRVHAAAAK